MKYSISIAGVFILALSMCYSCTQEFEDDASDKPMITRSSLSTTDYYWYRGERIGLNRIETKKFVLFEANDNSINLQATNVQFVNPPQPFTISATVQPFITKNTSVLSQEKTLMWAVISESSTIPTAKSTALPIIYEAPFFTSSSGAELGLSHLFYVKLKSESDCDKLTSLAVDNNITILGNNRFMPLWYTLACTNESDGNALEMANKFYETGYFAACTPDIMGDNLTDSNINDTYYEIQWNLHSDNSPYADINYEQAHAITSGGNSVIVAVLDQGIQRGHEDLPNQHRLSYDALTGQSRSTIYDTHGTSCAGIIGAATNNGKGIAGIAPGCMLMSISHPLVQNVDLNQQLANGINWAWQNGASIISNSWHSAAPTEIIEDAIHNALTQGRDGKGTVVVFAAGNDGYNKISTPQNTIADIIVVGATTQNGKRVTLLDASWGSNYGLELDVVAPGIDIPTTTVFDGGSHLQKYIPNFSGTSAACPHVAGVAALILSVNPNLTQRDVSNIIESTARKLDGYNYVSQPNRPNGIWNIETGYGLLDAYAAVTAAAQMTDLNIANEIFNSTASFSANAWIYAQDIQVGQNGNLILEAGKGIEISEELTVHQNGELCLRLQ